MKLRNMKMKKNYNRVMLCTLPYQDEKIIMEIPVEEKNVIYYFEKKK